MLDVIQRQIESGLKDLDLNVEATDKLARFVMLMDKWNKAYNLTSVRNAEDMVPRHILDSIVVMPHLEGTRFIDVGTGPGLPGLPLAIAMPHCHFTLLDSNGKRTRFMFQAALELGLDNIEIINSRVEAYQPAQPYDGVLSRAFASLSDMLRWCAHLPGPNGKFFALKAHLSEDELSEVPKSFKVNKQIQLSDYDTDRTRQMVVLESL
ncbi:16S rRNA (guanine(527)-N(7))-methyltransferase RsmG [Umboniibacter marinipuniceus]|uniref:Ribosomal RNA small subunit methyltransferase G n=1 Tax=Umboniibacter marinipuniceus TaxID=569599 RepID=A0A3M0ADC6_9GAMM|nr:16S rRNA (guanine(527)-N(7))-methyltransferase RsmG [Umboniibacter marinipuniceus]RMA82124.1 16S rRNA m(7)G-527 methyltransferase [Umboniibacter marinipuniceus]